MAAGRITRLVGVYDADGTVRGEVAYAVGHLLGRRSCDLCDITHGTLRRKPAFDRLASRLSVPFDLLHRDEQTDEMRALTDGRLACVLAETDGGHVILVDRERLAACDGAPDALFVAIEDAVRRSHLVLD